jgi:hypothetical protein
MRGRVVDPAVVKVFRCWSTGDMYALGEMLHDDVVIGDLLRVGQLLVHSLSAGLTIADLVGE